MAKGKKKGNKYGSTTSFSGADMLVYFVFPSASPVYIGTASTLTYSSFREVRQVRTLGRINLKGMTRGPRTIGGTLIFTVINQHMVNDIMDSLRKVAGYSKYGKMKPDELPPFDIIVSFGNEYGQKSSKVIFGATIVDDGMTLSIEDIFTENTMTYIGRDIRHMKDGDLSKVFEERSTNLRKQAEIIRRAVITPKITQADLNKTNKEKGKIADRYEDKKPVKRPANSNGGPQEVK